MINLKLLKPIDIPYNGFQNVITIGLSSKFIIIKAIFTDKFNSFEVDVIFNEAIIRFETLTR